MPKLWQAGDGNAYPVSDAHAVVIDAGVGKEWPAPGVAEGWRQRLLALSNDRRLTRREQLRLDAVTHLINMESSRKMLRGRDLTEVFGPTGTLDQVHGNSWSNGHPDACGCVLHVLFDHHKREQPDNVVHPDQPLHVCEQHCESDTCRPCDTHENCDALGDDCVEHVHSVKDFHAHHHAVVKHWKKVSPPPVREG